MPLAGRPLVQWSIEALRASARVGAIVVAVPPGHDPGLEGDDLTVVEGGATRSASVANALAKVEEGLVAAGGGRGGGEGALVAIHDAARPLLTSGLLEGVVATLEADPDAAGAIAATPVTDTIKRTTPLRCSFPPYSGGKEQRKVEETLDRAPLWAAQTPQVFRVEVLRAALSPAKLHLDPDSGHECNLAPGGAATDEAMLVEAAGGRVLIHPSPPQNLKVTTAQDLRLAELLLAER